MAKNGWQNPNDKKQDSSDLDTYLLIPVLFILLIIAAVESRADVSATTLNISNLNVSKEQPQTAPQKLNLSLGFEYASNLRKNSSPDKDDSASLRIEPTYNFSEKSNLSARIDLIQKFDSEKKSSVSNSVFVYTPTRFDLSKEVQFKPKVSITLPTDETLRDEQSYQGTISLRPTFEYAPAKIPGLLLVNEIYLNRNLHEYKTRNDYSANLEYSLRNRFGVEYQLGDKWSMEFVNDYVRSWTYGGYPREAFYFGQSLNYEFVKQWLASVTHENEGSVRGPNNNGENVEIFNEKSSYVSMGVTHVF